MSTQSRRAALKRWLIRGVILLAGLGLLAVATGLWLLNGAWPRERLRVLAESQAAQFLDGSLSIGEVGGSLLRDVRLRRVTLSRDGQPVIAADEIAVGYNLRRLLAGEIVIDSVILVRPRIRMARGDDGRWNVATLLRPRPRGPESGPPPSVQVPSIQVSNGSVEFAEPFTFAGITLPTHLTNLIVSAGVEYAADEWTVDVRDVSWIGREPDFSIETLTGAVTNRGGLLTFSDWQVQTESSRVTVSGTVMPSTPRRRISLLAQANPFIFQEWATIIPGLRRIGVDAAFEATIEGTTDALDVTLDLRSSGGDARGRVMLDTTVPGWHGTGELLVNRIDVSRWLTLPDRQTDATGHVVFDLDFNLGRRLPVGAFTFDGSRAAVAGYEASGVSARGRVTTDNVLLDRVTGRAYGANVTMTAGSIGLSAPYPYHFVGSLDELDLRALPETIRVPHVESLLAFGFDTTGRFQAPAISGLATFRAGSTLVGAPLDEGTVGTIDTTGERLRYRATGGVTSLSLPRVASAFELAWLDDPRYAGTITGRFQADGEGVTPSDVRLDVESRLVRGENLLGGTLSNGNVTLHLADGSLSASYDGTFSDIDAGLALNDPELDARMSGSGNIDFRVRDLLVRAPEITDYEVDANLTVAGARYQSLTAEAGQIAARMSGGVLTLSDVQLVGPALRLKGSGTIALDEAGESSLSYVASSIDLALLEEFTGRKMAGQMDTSGQLTGSMRAPRLAGTAVLSGITQDAFSVASGKFGYEFLLDESRRPVEAFLDGGITLLKVSGRSLDSVSGTLRLANDRVSLDLAIDPSPELSGHVTGTGTLDLEDRSVRIDALDVVAQDLPWRLQPGFQPVVRWTDDAIEITRAEFAHPETGEQRLALEGKWRTDGQGGLLLSGQQISIEALTARGAGPAQYGGLLQFEAMLTGTADRPIVTGGFTITNGRFGRLSYEQLVARLEFFNGMFEGGVRLDQSPGVWLSASGAAPVSLVDRSLPEQPIHVAVVSSDVDLGLLEGVTDIIDQVAGRVKLDVVVSGTSHDPIFTGDVDFGDASFRVVPTGVQYRNGRGVIQLANDQIRIETFRIEDRTGRTLEIVGSAGFNEFAFGDVKAEIIASRLELLRNTYGTASVDGRLQVAGSFESPRITGTLTITSGELDVGNIVDQMLFRPYATEARSSLAELDALRVLNPWDRMGIDIELKVPGTMRMVGENLQVTPGTPIGLGDFNLRATGDLYLYKDPEQPLYVTGSLDQITGTYVFQGRRFDLDPASSINFRGDLSPELGITVHRLISGVETSVHIAGPLTEPELQLTSNPPMDSSDILSLVVFNTSSNDLTEVQQQQLAVRAGTLAAGFFVSPLVSAIERSLNIDIIEIEPGATGDSGPRLTIGDEIAPGLVARFTRQFGVNEYDEATIEYYLSRLFRLRATFSDAGSQVGLSPFYRVERAGIDLLMFLSF